MEVKVTSWLEGLAGVVREQAAQVVRKTAEEIATEARASMRGPKSGRLYGGHRASAPGEAPAIQTGELVTSVQAEMIGEQEAVVGADTEYAAMLEYGTTEMAARPFLTPAAEKARPLFIGAMGRLLENAEVGNRNAE